MTVDGKVVQTVRNFCYLGDMIGSEGGSDRALKCRIAATWNKWREISGLLNNKNIPLKSRVAVYGSCIRSVMLYGTETWSITKRQEQALVSCDRRLQR